MLDQEGTKLFGIFDGVVWRRDMLVAKSVAPSVWATVFDIPDGRGSIGRNMLTISHGLLAMSRHYGLFGDIVITDGAGIQRALDSVVCFCLP